MVAPWAAFGSGLGSCVLGQHRVEVISLMESAVKSMRSPARTEDSLIGKLLKGAVGKCHLIIGGEKAG